MHKPFWNARRIATLAVGGLYVCVWLGLLISGQVAPVVLFWMVVPLLLLLSLPIEYNARRSTNGLLRAFLGRPSQYKVFNDTYPSYRYADLFRALERLAELCPAAHRLEHAHSAEALLGLIRGISFAPPVPSQQTKICIGYEQHAFFPNEVFWLLEGPPPVGPDERVVIRLMGHHSTGIEVTSTDGDKAAALLKWLAAESLARSIYRGQFLEIRYRPSPHADYEYYQESREMAVTFKPKPSVGAEDIILEDRVRALLARNVFDFFAHRDALYAAGVPRKRALLFYGPPGTGKTHTCRFVHTLLPDVTSVLVAGESLTRLQDIGKFARQLHPTLVVIEDVDLVFAAREHNPYGTVLGELMDQLDGFTADEEVMFILTTNAIERVEQAIRDRPGRINQCVYFGLPAPDLRRRYLAQYLKPYDISEVDLDHLVRQTDRTSQAFLKEYVLRAVQVAAEAAGYRSNGRLRLATSHFDVAFDELTSHGNPHGHAIMGFRVGER